MPGNHQKWAPAWVGAGLAEILIERSSRCGGPGAHVDLEGGVHGNEGRRHFANRPLAAIVKVSRARAKPPIFQLKEGLFTVGSAPQCDLVIAEQTVSRKHVTLEVCPEGVIVTDLGSRNGTFYLGHRIQKVTLSAPREATPGAPSAARTGKARPPGPRTAPAETAPAHAPPNPYKKQ